MKCINCWTSVVAFPFSKHSLLTPKQIQVFLHATAYIFIVCTYHLFFLSSLLPPSPPLQKALTKQLHPAQSPAAFQAFGCLYVIAEHGPPTLKSDSLKYQYLQFPVGNILLLFFPIILFPFFFQCSHTHG